MIRRLSIPARMRRASWSFRSALFFWKCAAGIRQGFIGEIEATADLVITKVLWVTSCVVSMLNVYIAWMISIACINDGNARQLVNRIARVIKSFMAIVVAETMAGAAIVSADA